MNICISWTSRVDHQVSVAAIFHQRFLGQRADQETSAHGRGGDDLVGGAAVFRCEGSSLSLGLSFQWIDSSLPPMRRRKSGLETCGPFISKGGYQCRANKGLLSKHAKYSLYRILWLASRDMFIGYCDYFPNSQGQFQYCGLIALGLLVSEFIAYCDYFALVPR